MPAFFLAWLLNSKLPGMTVYRAMFYIPVVASIVGSALVWFWIYNRDSGILNTVDCLFRKRPDEHYPVVLGYEVPAPIIGWLVDSNYSLLSLVILTSWATIGYDMVIFLAALQGIPRYLFEAATVDGASRAQSLFKITMPMMSATIFFVLVTNTIAVLQIFSEPYIMTQGGPANSTLTIVYYLYQKGFQRFQMGYGASLAWIVFAMIFVITTLQFRLANRWVYEEVDAMLGQVDRVTTFQKIVYYIVMTLLALIVVYPFIFMLTTSLKDSPEVFANIMKPFGETLRFDNYQSRAEHGQHGPLYAQHDLVVTIGVVIGQIITSMMGGYAFARINFPGRDTALPHLPGHHHDPLRGHHDPHL